jgi:hypothetical protein
MNYGKSEGTGATAKHAVCHRSYIYMQPHFGLAQKSRQLTVMDPMPIIVPITGKKVGLYYVTKENGVLCES